VCETRVKCDFDRGREKSFRVLPRFNPERVSGAQMKSCCRAGLSQRQPFGAVVVMMLVMAHGASAEEWRTPEVVQAGRTFADVEGFALEVAPAMSGRDELVPIPVRMRATEVSGETGRTVVVSLCVDTQCDVREHVKLKTGTPEAPAPWVTRWLSLTNGLFAVDRLGRQHTLLEQLHYGDGVRIALVGDETLVVPSATVLVHDNTANGSMSPGISPIRTERALFDEPSLVHAFSVVSVAPLSDVPAPLIVELRRHLHAGHVVVGDAVLRAHLVPARDDTVSKDDALSGTRPLARVGRAVTPAPTATLVAAPSGQPLRVGARGPLPVVAFDEQGGLFLERQPHASGEDIIDALLSERPGLALGRGAHSRLAYGEPRGFSPAVVLVARTLPSHVSWVFMGLFGLLVVILILRHRGRRSRTAFIVESAIVSIVLVTAILVMARVRGADGTTGEVVVWSKEYGAALTHETKVRAARAASTGERVVIAAEPGRTHVAQTQGNPVESPVVIERLPNGGFATSTTNDVALVVSNTGLVRLDGTLTVAFDDNGSATNVTNTTPYAFHEVRVLIGHQTKIARDVMSGSTVALEEFTYGAGRDDVGSRMVAAQHRLMQELSTRPTATWSARQNAHAVLAVGRSGTRVYGLEVRP
jgi:hypothetical protein